MTKAVLISSAGDPFLVLLVLKLWKKYWYDEVDKVYVCINTDMKIPPEILTRIVDDKLVTLIYHPKSIGASKPMQELVQIASEDLVMFLEEDGFICQPGIVSEIFKGIENGEYDAAGSPRRSCGQEIWDVSQKKYGLNYEGLGDKGPNFWPNFFFCKRSDLLKTDIDFGSCTFNPGDYCKELDYTFKELNYGDTFVWASMQLRAMGLKFKEIPQYHASLNETEEYTKHEGKWINRPPYIHGGSLSSGWSSNGFLLGRQIITEPRELETRVAFWKLASDLVEGFEDFKIEYRKGIETLSQQLDKSLINQKYNIYKELLGL